MYPTGLSKSGFPLSAGQAATEEVAITTTRYDVGYLNIYYVKSITFISGPNAGTHDLLGIAKPWVTQNGNLIPYAIVEDCATSEQEMRCTAHEIGHLLGLQHTDEPTTLHGYPRGTGNPAYLPSSADLYRLMYPHIIPNPTDENPHTLLIKPEWDIINTVP